MLCVRSKIKSKLIIDSESCKGCQLCIFYCPKKCLKQSDELNKLGYNSAVLVKQEDCTYCGICYLMCPDYAIGID